MTAAADDEDRRERDAAGRDSLEVDRDGEQLGEHRADDEQADAGPVVGGEARVVSVAAAATRTTNPAAVTGTRTQRTRADGLVDSVERAGRAQPLGRVRGPDRDPSPNLALLQPPRPSGSDALKSESAAIRPKRSLLFQCSMWVLPRSRLDVPVSGPLSGPRHPSYRGIRSSKEGFLAEAGFAERPACPSEAIRVPAREGDERDPWPEEWTNQPLPSVDARVVDLGRARLGAFGPKKITSAGRSFA